MTEPNLEAFWATFPLLDPSDSALRAELASRPLVQWPKGKTLVREGESCQGTPFVLQGSLQVFKVTGEGRQIKLYSIGPGNTCPLTTSALMGGDPFPAIVSVEEDSTALFLPTDSFVSLVGRSPSFRRLTFNQLTRRLGSVIELVEALAFRRLDQRLAAYLLEAARNLRLKTTHQELADKLGTSREVVTRVLGDFEKAGLVATGRGTLTILKPRSLEQESVGIRALGDPGHRHPDRTGVPSHQGERT